MTAKSNCLSKVVLIYSQSINEETGFSLLNDSDLTYLKSQALFTKAVDVHLSFCAALMLCKVCYLLSYLL